MSPAAGNVDLEPGRSTATPQARTGSRLWLTRLIAAGGLFVALFACLSVWAVSSPTGSSPDEAFHLDSIWCARDLPGPQCQDARNSEVKDVKGVTILRVPYRVVKSPCYAQQPEASASCQRRLRGGTFGGPANDGLYPSGFYRAMHVFVSSHIERSVVSMRVFNALIASALIVLALVLAPPGLRRASALAWLCTLVPLGMFFIPSVNPTSWVVIGLGVYWVFLLRFLTAPPGRGTWLAGVLAVLSAVMAMAARTDGAAFLCVITAACGLLAMNHVRDLRSWRYAVPLVLIVVGLARFLTQQSSSVVVSGASTLDGSAPGRSGLTLLVNNVFNLPTYIGGIFGQTFGLGWIDTVMPPGVSGGTIAAVGAVVALSVGASWRSKSLAMLLVGTAFVAVPLLVLQQSHARVGETVQPRYLYPLAVVLMGIIAYTSEDRSRPTWLLGRTQAILLVAAVSMANALALHAEIRRYVTGSENRHLNLNSGVEWWWTTGPSPMVLWLIGAVAGALLFSGLAALAVLAPRIQETPETATNSL